MIPILFEHDATYYSNHGLGDLIDCIECMAELTDEGEYELSLTYPVNAEMFPELKINRIVLAEVNHYTDEPDTPWLQLFRIYGYEKEIDGVMTIKCQHISYDLCDIPVLPFGVEDKTADGAITTANGALTNMMSHRITDPNTQQLLACPFTFTTDIPDTTKPQNQDETFKIDTPMSMRNILLDGDDSIKGTFGGDLIFDNFNISLKAVGGQNRGVVLEYGVDIMDLKVEENISEMVTAVYPYWKGRDPNNQNASEDEFVYGDIQYAEVTVDRQKIVAVDLTEQFPNSKPTSAEVNAKAVEWMTANHIGKPDISCTVSYAALGQDIRMYDEVKVHFPKMNIDVTAKVSKYKYNVLLERCEEVEISNVAHSSMWKGLEDASRLKVGLIPPKRIANNSITSDKIARGGVGGGNIAAGAVGSLQIGSSVITEEKIADFAVKGDKIAALGIAAGKIGSSVISAFNIITGAINGNCIGSNAVSKSKTDSGVQGTLTQVGNNTSAINDIHGYFSGNAVCSFLKVDNMMYRSGTVHTAWINGKQCLTVN